MQLAQINISILKYDLTDPRVEEFVNNLDPINALAEGSPGFVWRLKDDSGNATDINVFDDDRIIVNMSVWSDLESLKAYAYQSAHAQFLARRKQWFELPSEPHFALWWIDDGDFPDALEGRRRLEHLRDHGPTPTAFTARKTFPPSVVG